ncbi:uncharacterized protein LOC132608135 [Lycium barbarum]|uniref:uncharacterized protein LOC132608135 n=1 Tax=Lycium barbarum TaxID=112863 RepID=UPI00293E82AF|nr:uncharacterized protein LOC132608135 [Lycium barbarum]
MVYAFNDGVLRRPLWQDLRRIQGQVLSPWAITGDFNCVLEREEILGSPVTISDIREFKQCVLDCDLNDLRSSGAFYTWCNKQCEQRRVYSSIDKVLVNHEWVDDLPVSEVHFINPGLYDHSPGIIRWEGGSKGQYRFRYFNMWKLDPEFMNIVQNGWNTNKKGTKMFELVGKLNKMKGILKRLNKAKFSEVEVKAEQYKAKQEDAQTRLQLIEEEKMLKQGCLKWNKAKETFLRQKIKVNWLTMRDQNTKFFHAIQSQRDVP